MNTKEEMIYTGDEHEYMTIKEAANKAIKDEKFLDQLLYENEEW